MSRGRHRAAAARPLRLRLLGAGSVGALAFVGLAAAVPADSSAPTAERPSVELVAAGAALGEQRAGDVADRSLIREEIEPSETATGETEAGETEAGDAVESPTQEPLPEVTGQLWATDAVNVRTGPSVDDERLGTLAWAEQVDVTGETADGWTQVIWDEQVAWVSSSYLADAEPEQQEPADQPLSSAACATSPEIEGYLAANTAATYRAVCAAFPGVASAYGGYRAGDSGDHGSGHALDIMVSGDAGWQIASYLQAHASELGITYLIFQQQIWKAGDSFGAWEYMEDRGSTTANHYDHVHVSTY